MAEAQQWAADIAGPAYAIDDQTAITVVDGTVESSPKATGNASPLILSRDLSHMTLVLRHSPAL